MDYLKTLAVRPAFDDIASRILVHFNASLAGVKRKRAISARLEAFLDSPPAEADLFH